MWERKFQLPLYRINAKLVHALNIAKQAQVKYTVNK